jgi:hypothetical protein
MALLGLGGPRKLGGTMLTRSQGPADVCESWFCGLDWTLLWRAEMRYDITWYL